MIKSGDDRQENTTSKYGIRGKETQVSLHHFSHYPERKESDTLCSNNTATMAIFKHVISASKHALHVLSFYHHL